ncbi:MAG: hypothetical protein HF981_16440 [Desulfobacteraceae bacterium]|nr:hypothetical protein [Desulfobacteraceae bacterium]MBC2751978.1 hypothetical protein [Desulfobacteraceae bacterium]
MPASQLPDWHKAPFDRILVGQYRLIDQERLRDRAGTIGANGYHAAHTSWVEAAIDVENHQRDIRWTESVVVESRPPVEPTRLKVGYWVRGRKHRETKAGWDLSEPITA